MIENQLNFSQVMPRLRNREILNILGCSPTILEYFKFKNIARSIFDSCKNSIGATAGCISFLTENGAQNGVQFFFLSRLSCSVDPNLLMPLREILAEAPNTAKAVYYNDVSRCEWTKYLPEGHIRVENVLIVPLMPRGESVGFLCLANKPGGFTEVDVKVASAYTKLASVVLHESRVLESVGYSEECLCALVETASDAIILINSYGNIIFWNKAAEVVFGYSANEAVGRMFTFTMPRRFSKSHQEEMERMLSTGEPGKTAKTFEVVGLRKDGSKFPMELSLAMWKKRENVFFTGIIRDITERKRVEKKLKKMISELELSNEALESFSYSVSHDLRVPLRAIEGYSHILLEDYQEKLDDEGRRLINVIRNNTKKMGQLINSLLAFSRVGLKEIVLSELNMEDLAKAAFEELKANTVGRNVQLEIKPLPSAYGNRAMIHQVFVNLLSNAIKFTRPKENAFIEVGKRTGKNENIYYVKDNGVGFDLQYVSKLFGLFQRLHSPKEFEGIGVGLATVQRIIQKHGGRVWTEGKINEGATFYFSLPKPR